MIIVNVQWRLYFERVAAGKVVASRHNRDLVRVRNQQKDLVHERRRVRRTWRTELLSSRHHGRHIYELDGRDGLVVVDTQLLHKLSLSQVPNVDVAVLAGTRKYLVVQPVDGADLIEVHVLEYQEWLRLSRVPHVDAAVERT